MKNFDKLAEHIVATANLLDSSENEEHRYCALLLDEMLSKLGEPEPSVFDELVSMANDLDATGDEKLQKYASVLDEILLTIGSPRSALAQAQAKSEDEINRLREEYRAKHREELYHDRTKRELTEEQNKKAETEKMYEEQVKRYKPLEAPLTTRYCPDHPGAMVTRVADHVYQCSLDKKVYNYDTGFTTMKGNEVPGGGVEHQTKDWGNRDVGHVMFDTRQSTMSRFASEDNEAK